MLEYNRHLEELQVVSAIRENSGLYYFDSGFWGGGGGGDIENLKNVGTGRRNFTNNRNRGPANNLNTFFQNIYIRSTLA